MNNMDFPHIITMEKNLRNKSYIFNQLQEDRLGEQLTMDNIDTLAGSR